MKKDGHIDVASSRRMLMAICEDGQDMLASLPEDSEAELPTWWTNKLAVCSAYMNTARDYLLYSVESMEEERNETESENNDNDSEVSEDVSEEMTEAIEEAVEQYLEDMDDMLPPSAKMLRSENC